MNTQTYNLAVRLWGPVLKSETITNTLLVVREDDQPVQFQMSPESLTLNDAQSVYRAEAIPIVMPDEPMNMVAALGPVVQRLNPIGAIWMCSAARVHRGEVSTVKFMWAWCADCDTELVWEEGPGGPHDVTGRPEMTVVGIDWIKPLLRSQP